MAKGIFISYRRSDSQGMAGRIYDRLTGQFNKREFFFDVDDIPAGDDFVRVVEAAIDRSDVMLVIIGKDWSSKLHKQEGGEDFVLLEVKLALEKNIRIIPVLINDSQMPEAGSLPEEIKALSKKNAVQIRHSRFEKDIQGLVAELKNFVTPKQTSIDSGYIGILIFIAIGVLVIWAAIAAENRRISNERKKEAIAAMIDEDRFCIVPSILAFSDTFSLQRKNIAGVTYQGKFNDFWERFKDDILIVFGNYEPELSIDQYKNYLMLSYDSKLRFSTVEPFFISVVSVTNDEWKAVMGESLPKLRRKCNGCPPDTVAWDKIEIFLEKLNESTGKNFRVPAKIEDEYADSLGFNKSGFVQNIFLKKYHPEYEKDSLKFQNLRFRICSDNSIINYAYSTKDDNDWRPDFLHVPLDSSKLRTDTFHFRRGRLN